MQRLIIFFSLVFCWYPYANEIPLKILSYNVKGTPFPASRDHWRFEEIGKKLHEIRQAGDAPHLVLIQEAFINKAKSLNTFAKYPYETKFNSKKLLDSGLIILSDFPIIKTQSLHFEKDDCSSYDCLAKKGAQLIELKLPRVKKNIFVLNTHLQSGGSSKEDQIRKRQIDKIYNFLLKEVNFNQDLIFLIGDFNFKPRRESFHYFKELFSNAIHSGIFCLESLKCLMSRTTLEEEVVEETHDHHFFISDQVDVVPVFLDRNFRDKVRGKYLSDHFGYEVHYLIK